MYFYRKDNENAVQDSRNKNRESNLELLRILSMLLIVLHHYVLNSGISNIQGIQTNKLILQILSIGGKVGVNIFVLITGYFMIKSNFKIKKLVMLTCEVLTYSIFILILTYIFKTEYVTFEIIIKSILPIIFSLYWFAQAYVILYILSPFINEFINKSEKKSIEKLLIILFIIQTIIPTITTSSFGFSELTWFINLYIIGAYIRLYTNKILESKKIGILSILLGLSILIISIIFFDVIGTKVDIIAGNELYMTGMNRIPSLIIAVFIFIFFKNVKIKHNLLINNIASSTFGIYLIHENPLARKIIWNDIIKAPNYSNSKNVIVYALFFALLVFFICSVIDLIRQHTLEPIINKTFDKITNIYRSNKNLKRKNL